MQADNGVGQEQIARDLATWQAWFAEVLASGEYVAWVAEVDGQSAGTVGLMFFPQIPSAADPHTRRPQVANMAVRPEFRRRGLAGQLLGTALAWAQAGATGTSASTRPRWGSSSTAARGSQRTPIQR